MAKHRSIKPDKRKLLEELFKEHFTTMCALANRYIGDFDAAKDLVHDVFTTFWLKIDDLSPETNFRAYLYTAIRNRSLNFIRDRKLNISVDEISVAQSVHQEGYEEKELANEINFAICQLPDRCREVFELSRFEGKKYAEIAVELNISIKTVENQMGKALKVLREHLKDYLVILLIILFAS